MKVITWHKNNPRLVVMPLKPIDYSINLILLICYILMFYRRNELEISGIKRDGIF